MCVFKKNIFLKNLKKKKKIKSIMNIFIKE